MFYIIYQFIIQLKPKPLNKNLTTSFLGQNKTRENTQNRNFRRKKVLRPHLQMLGGKKADVDKKPTWKRKDELCFQELLLIARHVRC